MKLVTTSTTLKSFFNKYFKASSNVLTSIFGDFKSVCLLSTITQARISKESCSITVQVQYCAEKPGLSFLPSPALEMVLALIVTEKFFCKLVRGVEAKCLKNFTCPCLVSTWPTFQKPVFTCPSKY